MSHTANLSAHDPSAYQKNASFVYSATNSAPVLTLLDPQIGERIIDLGCGTGELTVRINAAVGPEGVVVGVDSNESMLKSASAASPHLKYLQADIQQPKAFIAEHPELQGTFDAVFTSATLHWCKDSPEGVLELVKWLLKDGGRMAFEFGGFGNTLGVRSAMHDVLRSRGHDPIPLDPWYFPTVAQYTQLLESHNLTPGNLTLVPRPTPLPTTLQGWLQTFARNSFLAGFSDGAADEILREVAEKCRPDCYWSDANPGMGVDGAVGTPGKVTGGETHAAGQKTEGWEVMYVRLRGVAIKPASGSSKA